MHVPQQAERRAVLEAGLGELRVELGGVPVVWTIFQWFDFFFDFFRFVGPFFFFRRGRKKGREKKTLSFPRFSLSLSIQKNTYLGTGAEARCASIVRSDIALDSLSARRDSSCFVFLLLSREREEKV